LPTDAPRVSLGIDVGGTNIKWVTLDGSAARLGSGTVATPTADEARVVDALEQIVATARERFDVHSIGIAVPGHVDRLTQQTLLIPNVAGHWNGFALGDEMRARTGLRPEILNDARAFALAELTVGSVSAYRNIVFATVGSGVGGALVVDGELLRNRTDSAGELGHMTYRSGGRPCTCGADGCVEAYAGGHAVAERLAGVDAQWRSRSLREAFEATKARPDDAVATITAEAVDALAVALASACALIGGRAVVLGGGLAIEVPRYAETAAARLASRRRLLGEVPVFVSEIGSLAGAIGAAIAGRSAVVPFSQQGVTAMSELASESWAQRVGRMPATSASEELA
jgi:glucokinase